MDSSGSGSTSLGGLRATFFLVFFLVFFFRGMAPFFLVRFGPVLPAFAPDPVFFASPPDDPPPADPLPGCARRRSRDAIETLRLTI